MNDRKNYKGFWIFTVLSAVTVCFIAFCIWMVVVVDEKRTTLESEVYQISIISNLEVDLIDCLDRSEDDTEEAFKFAIDKVVATNFDLVENPELEKLSEKTIALKQYFEISGVLMDFEPFQDDLQGLYTSCIAEKKAKRKKLSELSVETGNYWNYVNILLISTCLLSLLLIIAGFYAYRSKKKSKDLYQFSALFMESMVDCVISSDTDGIITQYNKVASEMFGFSKEEALGMSVRKLYATQLAWAMVKSELDSNNSYKGEIINQRKNGSHFVTDLSANTVFDANGKSVGVIGISRDISIRKQQEEQFQHIVDNATDIIYTSNLHGEITYVNTSAKNILGYSSEEMVGMPFQKLIHIDSIDFVEQFYNAQFQIRSKESYLEFKIQKANGEEMWVGQNVKTTFSATNSEEIIGFFGILRNLDDIKKVQLELTESELKYRELFDNSKDLIQSIDANGQILYVNDAWLMVLGYDREESEKLNLFDIIHEESQDTCTLLLEDILKLGTHEDSSEHILKMVTKNGEAVILKGTISVRYENGQVNSIQTFFRDVTIQSKIENALKQSEENFRLISSSINDVFFLYDVINERYDYISPNSEDVLGAPPSYFIEGKSFNESFIHHDDRELMDELNKLVRNGSPGEIEYRLHVSDSEIKWVSEKWFPILDENEEVKSISGVCRDVTDMKGAYDIIYNQNSEINQSIHYAENIQKSTLPTPEEIKDILPESFVFYKPKDILSGDFYVVETVKRDDGVDMPAFVVGDCTGHGVPGGLLSLLCSGLLTESLTNFEVNNPAEALGFVREKLIRLFRSNPSKYILDGMDAAFCVINEANNELYFAGANLSCFIVRGNEVLEYRGDKQHIGYSEIMMPFVHFSIDLEKGDQIYLTTDGYIDQFGGVKNKKFLRKRFTALLLDIKELPMDVQQIRINDSFYDWKGSNEQTDDCALIGVRY
ncbi:MAG: PAS domain S-box protein [Crocinitomix sp.]|nr:PAS domain S-box protein [Crocinitomix sp.]